MNKFMKKYEYRVVLMSVGSIDNRTLNSFGEDGWELVSVVDDVDNRGRSIGSIKVILKRELIPK